MINLETRSSWRGSGTEKVEEGDQMALENSPLNLRRVV